MDKNSIEKQINRYNQRNRDLIPRQEVLGRIQRFYERYEKMSHESPHSEWVSWDVAINQLKKEFLPNGGE